LEHLPFWGLLEGLISAFVEVIAQPIAAPLEPPLGERSKRGEHWMRLTKRAGEHNINEFPHEVNGVGKRVSVGSAEMIQALSFQSVPRANIESSDI